jgi:Asp-tRNA(Asn)/Glu-tRNA(Gln) amidotransferase A subunit family amidase
MGTDFRRALTRLLPVFMPDILFRLGPDGTPLYKEFEAAIKPTEFLPGKVFGSGTMDSIDYCVALSEGTIKGPSNLDIATIQPQQLANTFRFHISQYLMRRAEDWKAAGFHEALDNWAELNARSKFWGDDQRSAFKNWEETSDPRNALDGRQGVNERIMLREMLRRVDMMVLIENRLDAFVRLHSPWPPGIIGGPHQYDVMHNLRPESLYGPNAGLTEMLVPAGYVDTAYDPVFTLNGDATKYVSAPSDNPTALAAPGLPFSLVFRSEPGTEDSLLRIASAYEAASRRRVSPPDFGPLG